ncbi:hypothetical protein DPMN_179234 [Dreissena polymorpha]|uniref:Uncharacterized protein n=1 Tax=Dreissena polymorpha TaxID=45954 RepID=A0A9D4IJE0_DREPO|nr:hypothetical protein DPMN_179234 [Dreissena polymorpha]
MQAADNKRSFYMFFPHVQCEAQYLPVQTQLFQFMQYQCFLAFAVVMKFCTFEQ